MANIRQRLKRLESQMDGGEKEVCRQDKCRIAVAERLLSLFHSQPEKWARWERFKELYLRPGVSKLSDLSTEGLSSIKQIFVA